MMLSEKEIEAVWDMLRRLAKVYLVHFNFTYHKQLGSYKLTVCSGTREFTEYISETQIVDATINSLRFIEMIARRMAEDLYSSYPHWAKVNPYVDK